MSEARIVIGDVHGCLLTLKALIAQFPKDIPITFVGDIVDRGPFASETIDFIMENKYDCVLGNHESSYIEQYLRDYPNKQFQLFTDVQMAWMRSLPRILIYPECQNIEGRSLIVSHTFPSNIAKYCAPYSYRQLWSMGVSSDILIDKKKMFYIYGHTVVPEIRVTDFSAMIDTGACFSNSQRKRFLSAIMYPQMIQYTQETIEELGPNEWLHWPDDL